MNKKIVLLSVLALSLFNLRAFSMDIFEAINDHNTSEVIKILSNKDFNVNKGYDGKSFSFVGQTPLFVACYQARWSGVIIKLLMNHPRVNLDAKCESGEYKGYNMSWIINRYNEKGLKKILDTHIEEKKRKAEEEKKIVVGKLLSLRAKRYCDVNFYFKSDD